MTAADWGTLFVRMVLLWGAFMYAFALLDMARPLIPRVRWAAWRVWRVLCCLTGRHRVVADSGLSGGGYRLRLVCLDCPSVATLADGILFTPSRKYALRKRHGHAA